MKSYELNGKSRCNKRRQRNLNLSDMKSENFDKSILIKQTIKDVLTKKVDKKDVKDVINQGFTELNYPSEKTKLIHVMDATRQILRYVNCEPRCPKFGTSKTLNLFGLEVDIFPDLIFEGPNAIEVVKLKCSKPQITQTGNVRDKSAEKSLELYALLKYGESLIKTHETKKVIASFYYLRKSNDTSSMTAANFDEDYFNTAGGKNIVSLEEVYNPESECYLGLAEKSCSNCTPDFCPYGYICKMMNHMTHYDEVFKPQIEEFIKGDEECTEDDCKKCELNQLCNYKHAPAQIIRKRVVKSVRDLTLTEQQEEAISFNKGICRINAGAGAGKTLVVALRTVTLISNGVKPEEICLLTFTNTGADEMKERISLYNEDFGTGVDISRLVSTTFNAFGDEIIKNEYLELGFDSEPKIIDDVERSCIIADLLKHNSIEGLDYRNFTCDMKNCKGALSMAKTVFNIVKQFSFSKSNVNDVREKLGADRRFISLNAVEELIDLYYEYDKILKEKCLIEFADQEVLVFELLRKNPFYLEDFGFKHIIVDEFQDSNKGQFEIIKQLTDCPTFESLMVVGDDSQAIFGFRETSPEFIIRFFDMLEDEGEDFYLLENHRSTPEIIEFANTINALNKNRVMKDLIATREHGNKPVIRGFLTKDEEYEYIVEKMKEKIKDGTKYEDIAFIASNKFELLAMGDLLTKEGIPSVLLNPEPMVENSRVLAAIELAKYLQDITATKCIVNFANAQSGGSLLKLSDEEINEIVEQKISDAVAMRALPDKKQKEMFFELLNRINEDDEVYQSFIDTLKFKQSMKQIFEYCNNFLEYGSKNAVKRVKDYPGIVLTTAHSSKGLEWKVVFNSITKYDAPELHKTSKIASSSLEEKRRLLFVSATRARDELYITGVYTAYGKKGDYTYNQFLVDSYRAVGQEFNVTSIEEERHMRELEKAQEKKKETSKDIKEKIKKLSKTPKKTKKAV